MIMAEGDLRTMICNAPRRIAGLALIDNIANACHTNGGVVPARANCWYLDYAQKGIGNTLNSHRTRSPCLVKPKHYSFAFGLEPLKK